MAHNETSLPQLEALFVRIINKTDMWDSPEAYLVQRITTTIKNDFMIWNVKNIQDNLIQFIDHNRYHDNWKFRVCTLIFISILLDQCQNSSEKNENRWWAPLQPSLEFVFWDVLNDPDFHVLEYWMIVYHKNKDIAAYYWFPGDSFRSLDIPTDILQSIDIKNLIRTIPQLNPEIGPDCYWTTVCIVTERIRGGERAEMEPFLIVLVEMSLQKSEGSWKSTDYFWADESEVVLELVRLLWQLQPLHVSRDMLESVIDIIFHTVELNDVAPDEALEIYTELIDNPILHLQDVTLYDYYFNKYDEYNMDGGCSAVIFCSIINTRFQLALASKWDEGVQYLLRYAITETATAIRYGWGKHSTAEYDLSKTSIKLLKQYLDLNKIVDRRLLGQVIAWYNANLEYLQKNERSLFDEFIDYRKYPFPDHHVLIAMGQALEQQSDATLIDLCLTTQTLPLFQGILQQAFTSRNYQRIQKIMSVLLDQYIPLWEKDFDFTTLLEFTNLNLPRHVDWSWTRAQINLQVRQRFWHLQVLTDLIGKHSTNPVLCGQIFTQLYTTHGIWIIRWLIDGLLYLIHTADDWIAGVKAMGIKWTYTTIPSPTQSTPEDSGHDWLMIMLLQGCAANPTVHSTLTKHITNPAIPLPLRKLCIAVQSQYGTVGLDTLIPLEKWYPNPLREMAIQVMGTIKDVRMVPTLLNGMRAESPELRALCAWALGKIKAPDSFIPLLTCLEDSNPIVKIAGIQALGNLGDPQAVQPLLNMWDALKTVLNAKKKFHSSEADTYKIFKRLIEVTQRSLQQLGATPMNI